MLDREHRAGASEARLDLVGDQYDAVAVGEAAQFAQERERRGHEAAFTEHGLDDERGNVPRGDARFEKFVERRERAVGIVAAACVREGRLIDLGSERPEVLLVRMHLTGQREREERAAVVAVRERDHGGAARCGPRDLHRVLRRFGARREQQRLLREVAGCERVDALGHGHVALVHSDLEARVRERIELRANGGDDRRMAVAEVHDADAAREIDELAAIHIPEPRAFRARDEQRMRGGNPARDRAASPLEQVAGARLGGFHGVVLLVGAVPPSSRRAPKRPGRDAASAEED